MSEELSLNLLQLALDTILTKLLKNQMHLIFTLSLSFNSSIFLPPLMVCHPQPHHDDRANSRLFFSFSVFQFDRHLAFNDFESMPSAPYPMCASSSYMNNFMYICIFEFFVSIENAVGLCSN